jgi:hypothetical protein
VSALSPESFVWSPHADPCRSSLTWPVARVMRCLCSIHIFREIAEDVFVNNSISASLVGNDPLRAYCLNS